MDQNDNQGPGVKKGAAAAQPRAAGAGPEPAPEAVEQGLLEKARQIVDETAEVRPEKVAAVQEALEEGSYEIDSRQIANILITELILKS